MRWVQARCPAGPGPVSRSRTSGQGPRYHPSGQPPLQPIGIVNQIAVAEHQADILGALRRLKGKATVGDVVAATGLKADDRDAILRLVLDDLAGHQ